MVEGDLGPWADSFPAGLIPIVLELLLTTWPTLEHPAANEHEVAITRRFRTLLRRNQEARRLPFLIEREVPIDDEDTSEELGRLDLRFTHGYRTSVYLTFEGKRLNVVGADGVVSRRTSEYISDGMMRFVSGQYARGLHDGGMLAYVMNGDRLGAEKALGALISQRRVELRLATSAMLDKCEIKPDDDHVRQTLHDLMDRQFRIHHLLLEAKL